MTEFKVFDPKQEKLEQVPGGARKPTAGAIS